MKVFRFIPIVILICLLNCLSIHAQINIGNILKQEAAKEAKPIFISAIKQMSVKDATNILLSGKQDAATQYFKQEFPFTSKSIWLCG